MRITWQIRVDRSLRARYSRLGERSGLPPQPVVRGGAAWDVMWGSHRNALHVSSLYCPMYMFCKLCCTTTSCRKGYQVSFPVFSMPLLSHLVAYLEGRVILPPATKILTPKKNQKLDSGFCEQISLSFLSDLRYKLPPSVIGGQQLTDEGINRAYVYTVDVQLQLW